MPALSTYAARRKCTWFFQDLPRSVRILEVGAGNGWLERRLGEMGFGAYTGLDLVPPASVVGDINQWRDLGMAPESFDVIAAFEVVEHVDCFQACFDLLRPGGRLFLTSPVPERDWILVLLEGLGLNQQRTSPHAHLIDFRHVPLFELEALRRVAGLAQWGKFRKPGGAAT